MKFVTSVSKPPLLGFQYLRPPFTIRYVPVDVDEKEDEGFSFKHLFLGPTQKTARLPTAATCFNTLKVIQRTSQVLSPSHCLLAKGTLTRARLSMVCCASVQLPAYNKKSTLREKLLYSIRAGAGFELS